jgi:hypothetical protein
MSHRWSPADLGRQRRLVRGIALRAEIDRRVLDDKRRELKAKLLGTLASPIGLTGCFLAGFVIAMAPWPARAPRAKDDVDASAERKRHPLRLLLGAWLWLRRRQAQIAVIKERMAPTEAPRLEPDGIASAPPSEYIH